jgi:hypothetical protein
MTVATLKEITDKIGIKPDDVVSYHERKGKGIIEIDFNKIHQKKIKKDDDINVFGNIIKMAENLGINDLAENHDYYLYGTPKSKSLK